MWQIVSSLPISVISVIVPFARSSSILVALHFTEVYILVL